MRTFKLIISSLILCAVTGCTQLWNEMDIPKSSLVIIRQYQKGSYYHLPHHYYKVTKRRSIPKFGSGTKKCIRY